VDTPASPPPNVDPDLLRRAQDGDEAAFGELMAAHYEGVFRLVVSVVRHEHDARDICQDVWLTIWKKLPGFRGESRFTTWIHPIAVRRSLDHLRKRRRWYDRFLPFGSVDEEHTLPEPATEDTTRADAERTERLDRFNRALATLSPLHRTVLALREVQGLSYDEIAHATGIPVGTVMSRLHHARRHLAKKLKDSP
jgi:RNA polymerase sigma-70 factor (ECF subfamily)